MPDSGLEVTHDAALGGRLRLTQPKRGHRFGHDAILLAAAVSAKAGDRVADLGAGVGTAGLAVAARVPGIDLTLVDIEPALTTLAEQNIAANGFSNIARAVTMDATEAKDLPSGVFDHVLMNPPFNDATLQASPDALRRRAHMSGEGTLAAWITTAKRLLRPGGMITLIGRAEDLDHMTACLADWGALTILAIRSIESQPPIRAICRATKGGAGARVMLPDFVLNDVERNETAQARRVLRDGDALPLAHQ